MSERELCHECSSPADPSCSFADPTGKGKPIPLCREHRDWAEGLVNILKSAPELRRPTRFDRI
jgi:hypothetical protein